VTVQDVSYASADGWPTYTKQGWLAAEFDQDAALHIFSSREVDLLVDLAHKTKAAGMPVSAIVREEFDHPKLHHFFVDIVMRFKSGQGLQIFQGFPVHDLPLEDIWRIYWGIGTHFGLAVSQNIHGHLQGQVMVQPSAVGGRVYASSVAAALHSDRTDILSLLCINKARRGGENTFVSALKIWELLEAERPDIFERLKIGYPQHRNGEQPEGDAPVTPYRVPVFGEVGGLRSAYFGGNALLAHQSIHFSEMLTSEDIEALEYLQAVISRPELALTQQLQPGQAVFINNMEMLHSRTAFEDWAEPERQRRLLRLWLQGRLRRPYPADMNVIRNRSGNLGIEVRASEQLTVAD
jgi:Taurine catabolism dioxygenase TauD, TfdA family